MNRADPLTVIREALVESAYVTRGLIPHATQILEVASMLVAAFEAGNRIYACGNGGSATDAIHLVEELVARYKQDRPGLPAHHLLDAATLTCWSNDHGFETAFARQVEALTRRGDVLLIFSTSGNSANVLAAAQAARTRGVRVVGLTGRDGGRLRDVCDACIIVSSDATERIQEAHITIVHLLCELIERMMFGDMRAEPGRDEVSAESG